MSEKQATNITWHHSHISRDARLANMGQRGCTVWFTGLSGSGKSTVAAAFEKAIIQHRHHAYRLDGDNIRHGLCANLGFSAEDREENIRRIGEVAKLFADAGLITITSFISPYRAGRNAVRQLHDDAGLPFFEVFIDCPVEEAERRDPKGLYKKARAGQIKDFTGIDAPFEEPLQPQLVLRTNELSVEQSVGRLITMLERADVFNPPR